MKSVKVNIKAPAYNLFERGVIPHVYYKPSLVEAGSEEEGIIRFLDYVKQRLEESGGETRLARGEEAAAIQNTIFQQSNLPDVPQFVADSDFPYSEGNEWSREFRSQVRLQERIVQLVVQTAGLFDEFTCPYCGAEN